MNKHKDTSIQDRTMAEDETNDCPIEQVRLTVPITDDPKMADLSFRTWVLGMTACAGLAFINQFFGYRQNQLSVSSVPAQIVTLPLGKLMAATLPTRRFRIPLTNVRFTMNPGPFTMKEHVLITILASTGAMGVYGVNIITIVKAFYHRKLSPLAGYLLAQTTQLLGYGFAGMFRNILVDSPYMWWPSNLVQISLFRALHEKDRRPKGGLTRLQFFLIVFVTSFSYYLVPSYLFPTIASISFICLIWKDSVTAQQLGSGLHGLGIGSFAVDWSTVVSFLPSPLATPAFAIVNVLIGFFLVTYVMIPIVYWFNIYEAKKFPIFSSHTFDQNGQPYNLTRILNADTFDINLEGYESYSKLYITAFFAFTYGLGFAAITSTLSHITLFHGKDIWQSWMRAKDAVTNKDWDVHTRIIKRNYEEVPSWWYYLLFILTIGLSIYTCEGFGKQFQLPWWGILLACLIALTFTLPIGILAATANQGPGLNIITEMIIGYILPGKPLANVTFKTYGYISMVQAHAFLQDLKLGHYMKIAPKKMFMVQLVGTLVSSTVYFGTSWWLLESVEHICDPELLPKGSPWTCPGDDVFYSASIIWGVVGPGRMFTKLGVYPQLNWFFLVGLLAPVPIWLLARKYPDKKWISLINMPIIIGATMSMPPAKPVNYLTWGAVGLFFSFYVYRKHKAWWARYNYVLSAGLDAGVAFMGILIYFTLQSKDINGPDWWGLPMDDHCPLAKCPTAPGVVVKGCPVF